MFRLSRVVGLAGVGGVAALSAVWISKSEMQEKKQRPLVFAGVEGGGTTWRVAIAVGSPTNVTEKAVFETTTPDETLGQIKAWLGQHKFDALGIASFGPVDLHKKSPTYGYITTTPKEGWKFTNVRGPLSQGLPENFPIGFDTDVNAPAMAEYKYRSDQNQSSCAYVTVGTGVGVGLVVNGQCVHGLLHPEGGHISIPRHKLDAVPTVNPQAPFGGENIECYTNSEALARRAGVDRRHLQDLGDDNLVWEIASHNLAALCANMILLVSPERIVLSGGIMHREVMFPTIRKKVQEILNGYINVPQITTSQIDQYIVPSALGHDIGLIGALVLAENAYNDQHYK